MSDGTAPPTERALARISLREFAVEFIENSPAHAWGAESKSVLRDAWYCGALTALRIVQELCRAAPAVRDDQVARLLAECWEYARNKDPPVN